MSDDNASQTSTTSVSRVLVECPECQKEFQQRYLFNHIRKVHPNRFELNMMADTEEDFLGLKFSNCAVPFKWHVTNDFDEQEERVVFGCLACNSTFAGVSQGINHCKKDKCNKKHKAEIDNIVKHNKQMRELELKRLTDTRWRKANRNAQQIFDDTLLYHKYITEHMLLTVYKTYMNSNVDSWVSLDYEPTLVMSQDRDKMIKQERDIHEKLAHIIAKFEKAISYMEIHTNIDIRTIIEFRQMIEPTHPVFCEMADKLSWLKKLK
jgi:hypothetical protein